MPLKSWIDARSPGNSSFQSFCSEGAAAAGLRQEIGQTYLITIFRTNLQMDDGDGGYHCQFRWSQLRGSKRHRGLWGRRRRWSLKVRVLCRYNWESHHSRWKRKYIKERVSHVYFGQVMSSHRSDQMSLNRAVPQFLNPLLIYAMF